MKAIVICKDRSLAWQEVADPILQEEEVLIKVAYAAVNRADLMQREGNYPPPKGCPEWPGLEVSGTIVKWEKSRRKKAAAKRRQGVRPAWRRRLCGVCLRAV